MAEPGLTTTVIIPSVIATAAKILGGGGKSDQERCLEKVQRQAVRKCIEQVDLRMGGINEEQRRQIKKQCQAEVRRNPGVINAAECTLEAGVADCTRQVIDNCLDGVFETPDPLDEAQMPPRAGDPGIIRRIPSEVTNVWQIIQARGPARPPVRRRPRSVPGAPPVLEPLPPQTPQTPFPGVTVPSNIPPEMFPELEPPTREPVQTPPARAPEPVSPPFQRPGVPEVQPATPRPSPVPTAPQPQVSPPARPRVSPPRPEISPPRPATAPPAVPRAPSLPGSLPAAIGIGVASAAIGKILLGRQQRTRFDVPGSNVPRPSIPEPSTDLADQLSRQECPPCEKEAPEDPRDQCFKGIYVETPFNTRFTKFAEVDCFTGRQIGDNLR